MAVFGNRNVSGQQQLRTTLAEGRTLYDCNKLQVIQNFEHTRHQRVTQI